MENVVLKYSDFILDDGGLKRTKDDFIKLGDALIEKAKQVQKEAKFINLDNLQGVEQVEKKTGELLKLQSEYEKSLKKIDTLEKKLNTQRKKTAKAITKETEALKKQRAEARQVARIKNTQVGTVENLRAKLSLVTTAWTKLTKQEIENTKRGQRLNESKRRLTETLSRLEAKTGDNRRSVGRYSNALSGLRGRFIRVTQAAGITLGVFGAFRLIRNSISIVKDYEKSNATLAGVLNKTTAETKELQQNSQELGATTVKTAQEVVELQTAYARLGFSQQEILDLAKPTIDGSIALNAGLKETATLVGAVVNSFDNLGTTDAPKIMEILSAATTKSALDFTKLNVALPIVAGAANALDVPLSEVTATLGKLADAGIQTETGATALRNIFIESAKRGIDYKQALDLISKSQDKLTVANRIFGKRAAVSALVIAKNSENVAQLTKELENAEVVQKLVNNELNTLDGSLKLLRSAWEGYILELNDASGSGNALSKSVRFLAENLQTVLKVVAISAGAWLTYLATVKSINFATKIQIGIQALMTKATVVQTAATQGATVAQRTFNTAVKANPIGLLVALLAAAVTAFIAFRDSATSAEKAQRAFNKAKEDARDDIATTIKEEISVSNDRIEQLKQEITLRRAKGENSKKLDKEYITRQKAILKEDIDNNRIIIDSNINRDAQLQSLEEQRIKDAQANTSKLLGASRESATFGILARGKAQVQEIKNRLSEQRGVLTEDNEQRIKLVKSLQKRIEKADRELTVSIAESTKDQKKAYLDRIKELALLRRRLEDLQDQSIKDDETRDKQITKRKFDREIKAIKGNSAVEIELRKELEKAKLNAINEITKKYANIRLKVLKEIENLELSFIEDKTEREIESERLKSEKIIDSILKNTVISEQKRRRLIEQEEKRTSKVVSDIKLKGALKEIEDQKQINIAKINLSKKDFKTEEEFEKYKEKKLNSILLESLKKRLELIKKSGSEKFKVEIAQIESQIADLSTVFKKDDSFKEFAEAAKQVVSTILGEIERIQQRTLQSIEKTISDQQKAVDRQRALAEKGLVNTLAFEQKELAKNEAEKIKQQKRIERLEKVKALYSAYNSYSQNDEGGNALLKALRDFAILESVTASFGDGGITGIDGVSTNSKGITRGRSHNMKKGVLAYHEGGEGFLSRKEVDNMGHDNFYKLKSLASNGNIDKNFFSRQRKDLSNVIVSTGPDNSVVVKELQNVQKAISSRPSQLLDVESVVGGVLKFTEKVVEGNKTKRNHYKIKKRKL